MATYVLLHGGAAGAWIWKFVEQELRAHGHAVHCITFTGFGERRHLTARDSTVETHVADVINALEFGDIDDAILVVHSYSGTVAPGVVAAAGARIRRVIYLDALVVSQGEPLAAAMGFIPAPQCAALAAGVRSGAMPVYAPVGDQQRAEAKEKPFRMSAERQAWMLAKLTTMPMIANVNPVLVGAESITCPVDYIAVSDTIMKPMHDRARKLGWTMHDIEGDHAILVGDPEATARLLEQLA